MNFIVAALLSVVCLVPALAQRPRAKGQERPPDVAVVSLRIEREGSAVIVEGKLRNTSPRPLRGLTIYFEFLEFNGRMISRMHTEVTEEALEPGAEGEFTAQTPDQVRAVSVRLDAEDGQGRTLRLDKPGPHTIQ